MPHAGAGERIERAALWAWPPKETARRRLAPARRTRRADPAANSVQTLVFAAGADVERAIGRVEAWYATRGLPACFQLTERSAPARLDAELEARGYARLPPVSVLLLDAAGVEPPRGLRIELQTRPTPQVMNAVCDPLGPRRAACPGRAVRPHPPAARVRRPVRGQPARRGWPVRGRRRARGDLHPAHQPCRSAGGAMPGPCSAGSAPGPRHAGARQVYLQVEDENVPGAGAAPAARRRARLWLLVPRGARSGRLSLRRAVPIRASS